MAIIVPNYVTADDDTGMSNVQYCVFLDAFAVLKVERRGRGFHFHEVRHITELDTETNSLAVLDKLTSHIEHDDSLAGYRLDRTIAALIRVPFGEQRGATAKASLQRLHTALANDVMDVAWYDHERKWTLQRLASDYALPAEWDCPDRQISPAMLERQLSAKAQSIWLSIAHEWLSLEDLRRALADYDVWRTHSSIV
jgi:hypothetical protein